jgi:opacity protein-like surface antigen
MLLDSETVSWIRFKTLIIKLYMSDKMRQREINKILFLLVTAITLTINSFADSYINSKKEAEEYYLRIDSGISMPQKIYYKNAEEKYPLKNTYLLDIGIGKHFNEHLRADLVLSTRQYKLDSFSIEDGDTQHATQKIRSTMLMLNGYYDITKLGIVTPYLSAGAGVAFNKAGTLNINIVGLPISLTNNNHTNTSFVWQIGAGAAINLVKNLDLDIEYKFINMGSVKPGSGTINNNGTITQLNADKGKLKANEVTLGIRYNF